MLTEQEERDVEAWVHRVEHLRHRKGQGLVPEGHLVAECWAPWTPPEWALTAAAAGEPGSAWCPQITPNVTD